MKRRELASGGKEGTRPMLVSNLAGKLGTGGLASSTSLPNQFGKNVGVALPLNGNTEELLFLGEIRGA
ncbi:MAG: hypothetical protein ACK4WF_05980 [Candidatus Brocadiales bacterium]